MRNQFESKKQILVQAQTPTRTGAPGLRWVWANTWRNSKPGREKNKGTAHGHMEKLESFAGPLEVLQNIRDQKGPWKIVQSNAPPGAGPPRSGHKGTRPGRFWVSTGDSTTPWATCSSALPPSPRSFVSYLSRISHISTCTHCPLSCHWVSLRRGWLHPPDTRSLRIYKR